MPTVLDVSEEPIVLFGAVNGASTYRPVDVTTRAVVFFGRGIIANVEALPDAVGPTNAFGTLVIQGFYQVTSAQTFTKIGKAQANQSCSPASIAGSATLGDARLADVMNPVGISDGDALGTATVAFAVYPQGVASSASVGTAATRASVTAQGFADADAVGTPSAARVMSPDSVSSSPAFGTPQVNVSCAVESVVASTSFGEVSATKFGWIFRTPVNTYKWRLFKEYEGISLLKENGVWSEVAHPDLERTRSAQRYLAGARDHVVSTSLKAELEGLGYAITQEIVSTEEYL